MTGMFPSLDQIYTALGAIGKNIGSLATSLAELTTAIVDPAPVTAVISSLPLLHVAPYPSAAVPIIGSSGDVANSTATASISSGGLTVWITGLDVYSSGATAASVVNVTVSGMSGGTLNFPLAVAAGAAVQNSPLSLRFNPPLQGAAVTPVSLSVPGLGAGNLHCAGNIYGYRV